jgi:hypothetical protein
MFVGNAIKVRLLPLNPCKAAGPERLRLTGLLLQKAASHGVRRMASSALKSDAQLPAYVLNAPATEMTTLKNGVRVASEVSALRDAGWR